MGRKRTLLAVLLLAPLAACSSVAVDTQHDPGVDFSNYRTWDWLPTSEMRAPDPMAQNPFVDKLIRAEVESGLAARGFPREPEDPEFLVTFITGVKDRLNVTHWGYGYGGRWGPSGGTTVSTYREGTLILDFIDTERREVIWRGSAQAVVQDPEVGKQNVREGIARMLDHFPPAK